MGNTEIPQAALCRQKGKKKKKKKIRLSLPNSAVKMIVTEVLIAFCFL